MLMFNSTNNLSLTVAFVTGLFSALHCLGMCGSIIGTLTLSVRKDIRQHKSLLFPFILSYNLGRIASYTLGGILVGLLGHMLGSPFGENGHRSLQIVSAVIMAGAGLHIAGWFPRFAYIERAGGALWRTIEPLGRNLLPVDTYGKAFLFGAIWGWLPCGLVYATLAVAGASGHVMHQAVGVHALYSGLTMLAFGLGTLPAVMGVGIMTGWLVKLSGLKRFRWMTGVFLIVLALMAAFPHINPMMFHG